jgi:predicted nucleic acid-binding protein
MRGSGDDLIAPSLIVAEIGNAVWKRAIWREVSVTDAVRALQTAIGLFTQLIAPSDLAARSTEIAIELHHPIYDCFYVALAERERCPLITADKRLIAVAKAIKGVELRPL